MKDDTTRLIGPRLRVGDWLRVQTMVIALESAPTFKAMPAIYKRRLRATRKRLVAAIQKERGLK